MGLRYNAIEIPELEEQRIVSLYQKGSSMCSIAKELTRGEWVILRILRKAGIPIKKSPFARLSDVEKHCIIDLYVGGTSMEAIVEAKPYGKRLVTRALNEAGIQVKRPGSYINYPVRASGTKVCSKCRAEKTEHEFGKQPNSAGVLMYRGECLQCASKRSGIGNMLRKYGITQEDYDIMFAEQNGLCASCGLPEWYRGRDGKVIRLSIDHNHQTDKVRHLLCCRCNKALGSLREDPDLCELLKQYALRIREEGSSNGRHI